MRTRPLLKLLALFLSSALLGGALPLLGADAPASTKSSFTAQHLDSSRSLKASQELSQDDGQSAGKRSVAGSGHAVRFEAPGKESYLTARVFGSRYGQPTPPNENAFVWLCDAEFKLIAAFPTPYANFTRGVEQWVTIPIKPIRVPQQFVVAIGFNPTGIKGVYVHHDSAASGNSFLGLPGRENRPFKGGDWLLRPVLQEVN